MTLRLDDKYRREEGTVFLTGMEAILRLVLEKQRSDAAQGAVNQTYISGYEGSPLGGLDLKLVEQIDLLNERGRTLHQFGINEKTAASAMLGTQFAESGDIDAFWYGKAHGTMWVPDEVWLANLSGTADRGSMVLLAGEDHQSKSSVSPGTSDGVLRSCMVPIFYPSTVSEVIELGRHAVELSRHAGIVTALKLVTPVCDGASTVDLDLVRPQINLPERPYEKSFNRIVMATRALPMQRQLVEQRLPLAEAYIRKNGLNRIVDADVGGSIGIIATGKSYVDVRQALDYIGARVPVLHLRVSYPLDAEIVRHFARDLKTVYLVEEPGPFVEDAVRAALWGSGVEVFLGQWDEDGAPFVPAYGEVHPEELAHLLADRLGATGSAIERLRSLGERSHEVVPQVTPMSCGGCPYNSFRSLDEKPGGAIGCSSIRAIPAYDNGVLYIPTMGAGGSIYSGWAPFNGNRHIFQYLGDGSYFHSGRGAIQSCVQGEVNITFLLLFNGVVALTGGQDPGGVRGVFDVVQELLGMGVGRVGIVSARADELSELNGERVQVYTLEEQAQAQNAFKQIAGTTVLILDKECATERGRRDRRQGIKPDRYVLINDEICEGCGDCYTQSEGCAALHSVDTEWGKKTQVRQAHCAQDELCIDGECPAFVVAHDAQGHGLRRRIPEEIDGLPEPPACPMNSSYSILAVGRGGTGVVTFSHLLAYAAMLEGKQVYLSNNTGLAQKGGPVEAPIVLSEDHQPAFNHLFPGEVDLYLGFDLLRAAEGGNMRFVAPQTSRAAVSTAQIPTAEMNRNPRTVGFPEVDTLVGVIESNVRKGESVYIDTYWLAEALFSDILYANMILLGAAYQAGMIPVKASSLEWALELNGKAVENNVRAFRWGRLAVADPSRLERMLGKEKPSDEERVVEAREIAANHRRGAECLGQILGMEWPRAVQPAVARRFAELCEYQDAAYAEAYFQFVEQVLSLERERGLSVEFTDVVAHQLFRMMAYKDEYEVARLATNDRAVERLESHFAGAVNVSYRLQPPALRWLFRKKVSFGSWFHWGLCALKRGKKLRGTPFDPFGYLPSRRLERELIDWYRQLVEAVLPHLDGERYSECVELARSADEIRGFEGVKERAARAVRTVAARRLERLQNAG